jgi:hypothetical protein
MNNINIELQKILVTNPDVIGSGYGKKVVNNLVTEEKCLSFGVKKKLPLNEVSPENLIPSEIEIDGVVYKTDVNEIGEIKPMACSLPSTCYDCYDGSPYGVPCATNASTARPIKGGTVFQVPGGYGTLGFFAVHTPTQAIVAITNAHVADILPYLNGVTGGPINRAAYSLSNYTKRAPLGVPRINQPFNRYNYTNFGMPAHIDKNAGPPYVNNIDAAMVAVYQYDANNVPFVTNAESWKQIGLSDIPGGINTPPTFASTQELDALLDFTNLEVWSSGARTGVKKDGCSFKIISDDFGFSMAIAGSFTPGYYENTIQITRFDTSCLAINGGDSGSALMGKVPTYNPSDPNWKDGPRTWKILGLIYAGNGASAFSMGIACRIDHVAAKLQIEAWDGSPKPFLDIPNMDYKVLEGVYLDASKTIDSKEYWQLGLIAKQSTIFS